MYQFFTLENFSDTSLLSSSKLCKVGVGQGVLLKANGDYQSLITIGLRTCVAFALINPADHLAVLVHFFHLTQIKNDLRSIVSSFMEKSTSTEEGILCVVAGGRAFNDSSEEMCKELINYVTNELLDTISHVKVQIKAPVVAAENETLSLIINLATAETQIALTIEDHPSECIDFQVDSVNFIDLTIAPAAKI